MNERQLTPLEDSEDRKNAVPNANYRISLWDGHADDLEDLLPFLEKSHGQPVDVDWARHKLASDSGRAVAAIAFDSSEPIGIVAFGINSYIHDARPITTALSYDTFVAPAARGRGLFLRLLEEAEEACRIRGAELLLNFPNDNSRPGFTKAGWTALNSASMYIRPVVGSPAHAARTLSKLWRSRSMPFRPERTSEVSAGSVAEFTQTRPLAEGLQMDLSTDHLAARLDPRRGQGYSILLGNHIPSVVRLGMRGDLREVQLLATAPRRPDSDQLRRLSRSIRSELDVDVISILHSSSEKYSHVLGGAGFLKAHEVTVPFAKSLGPLDVPENYTLTGVDIHTW